MGAYVQRNQPEGVAPLALTGERTLPDIPEENYWFQRHLAVYQWIARRESGSRLLDMACGEGYGAACLAARARSVIGVDGSPQAYEHARQRYRRANLRFERAPIESFRAPAEVVVCLQTIEHLPEPRAALEHFRSIVGRAGRAYISTPNVFTLAPPGASHSGNPWHVREYRPEELAELCAKVFASVEVHGLFHARKLQVHELALRCGWDALHRRLRLTERFYARFIPAISTSDFVLKRSHECVLDRALDLVAVCRG